MPHLPAPPTRFAFSPVSGFWLTLCPPPGEVSDTTNSWLYVPLLHAAAADLAPAALEAWRTDPRSSDWWERTRQLLAASAPVTPQFLVAALARAAEAAPTHAHHMPDLVERINNASLPTGACVHVGWAVRQLREPDGYLLTPVQEALLECFGGHQLASAVDRHSDRFQPFAALPAPPPAAGHAAVQPSTPKGRGRGHRTTSNPQHPPHPAPAEPPPPTVSDPPPGRAPTTTRRERAHALSEAGLRLGLASLDSVHLQSACRDRTLTLQSSPARARGALRTPCDRPGLVVTFPAPKTKCAAGSCLFLRPACSRIAPPARPAFHQPSSTAVSSCSGPDVGMNSCVKLPLRRANSAATLPPTRCARTVQPPSSMLASSPPQLAPSPLSHSPRELAIPLPNSAIPRGDPPSRVGRREHGWSSDGRNTIGFPWRSIGGQNGRSRGSGFAWQTAHALWRRHLRSEATRSASTVRQALGL